MDDTHDKLMLAINLYVQENEKFEKEGVKVSAVRARQALNDMKQLIVERRKEIRDGKLRT